MKHWTAGATVQIPAVLASVTAFAQTPSDRPYYWHDGWGWGHIIFGSLMMILFWGGIILVVVLAVRWFGGSGHRAVPPVHTPQGRPPLDILKERFARGEIDKEEFEERRRVLGE